MVLYYFLLFALCVSKELFEDYYAMADEFMKNMSFEDKISQMIFPRFNYKNRTDDIINKKPGGYVLFAYDFEYNATFIQNYMQEIQNLSKSNIGLPLGLSVDEEGGTVVRVSKYHRSQKFPSPQEIYNKSGNDGIAQIDKEKRDLLRKFFLNVNLAPVADISSNSSDYIYPRTIGRNALESAEYIEKDVEGYVKDNFTCCAKHFPGYGNNIDTHGDIAIDERSYEQFQQEDFLTFEAAIRQQIPMILVSHNIVKCKDDKHPASLSKAWHDILRNELNFTGLILTDDLSMGAIKKYTDNVSEAVLAVNAGNDILLTSDYYMHYNALMEAIKDGSITEAVVNKACRRIIALKYKYLIPGKEKEPENNHTTLIIVSIVLGVLILGALIVFLVLYLKNRKKKPETDGVTEEALIKE
jgi:beta-N-acetylhexosaminidase